MDYGHTAQNGQVAPQFGDAAVLNGNMTPNASLEATQNVGANAMGAYTPGSAQPQAQQSMMMPEQMPMPGQMVPQEQMMTPNQMMSGQVEPQSMMSQQMPQSAVQPQVAQAQAAQPQAAQTGNGNALESLKQGVDLNGGLSSSDVAKMDEAIRLLDQMGPADFYEQFSAVTESTVSNNYGVKVDS